MVDQLKTLVLVDDLVTEIVMDYLHAYACKHIWCVHKGSSVMRTNEVPTGTTHMNGHSGSVLGEFHPLLTPVRKPSAETIRLPNYAATTTPTETTNTNGKNNEEGEHNNKTSVVITGMESVSVEQDADKHIVAIELKYQPKRMTNICL